MHFLEEGKQIVNTTKVVSGIIQGLNIPLKKVETMKNAPK